MTFPKVAKKILGMKDVHSCGLVRYGDLDLVSSSCYNDNDTNLVYNIDSRDNNDDYDKYNEINLLDTKDIFRVLVRQRLDLIEFSLACDKSVQRRRENINI